MVEAGLTPLEVIAAGTRDAARLCGIGGETGTLEVGKAADLLVVDGDPSSDIAVLRDPRKIVAVMRSGCYLKGEATLRCLAASQALSEREER
jgi:imidazolonepropionase-like amidohydrolase